MTYNYFYTLLFFFICSCSIINEKDIHDKKSYSYSRTQFHMGTKIQIYGLKNNKQYDLAFNKIRSVDSLLSTYKPDSSISKLNRGEQVVISEKLKSYILLSLDMQRKTNNYFNPALGGITKKFKKHHNYAINNTDKNYYLSTSVIVKKNLKLPKNIKLDFGAIGKGFAVWEAVRALKTSESPFIIKASGDLFCNKICNFHIEKPIYGIKKLAFRTCKPKQSISTSGNYRNYLGSKNNNHLINPKTGDSQQITSSLTVVSSGPSYEADALATALSVAPSKKHRLSLIKGFKASYLHISPTGRIEYGANFNKYFCYQK